MQVKGSPTHPEPVATPRELGLAALQRWRAEKPWARMDPATLEVSDVLSVGPTQVILESTVERRGVEYDIRQANTAPDVQDRGPDPWDTALRHPEGQPVGSKVRAHLPHVQVHKDCGLCSRSGETMCMACGGHGQVREDDGAARCGTCNGRGQVRCDSCGGSGGVVGTPTVWSSIELHRELRVIEATELPMEVFLELQSLAADSVLVHTQQDTRIEGLRRSMGYRDDATQGPEARLHTVVGAMAAAPGVEPGDRILRQRLEVRQVPVFQLVLPDQEPIFVYGEPPRLSPTGALLSAGGKLAKVAPWVAVAATLVAGALYAWSV